VECGEGRKKGALGGRLKRRIGGFVVGGDIRSSQRNKRSRTARGGRSKRGIKLPESKLTIGKSGPANTTAKRRHLLRGKRTGGGGGGGGVGEGRGGGGRAGGGGGWGGVWVGGGGGGGGVCGEAGEYTGEISSAGSVKEKHSREEPENKRLNRASNQGQQTGRQSSVYNRVGPRRKYSSNRKETHLTRSRSKEM